MTAGHGLVVLLSSPVGSVWTLVRTTTRQRLFGREVVQATRRSARLRAVTET